MQQIASLFNVKKIDHPHSCLIQHQSCVLDKADQVTQKNFTTQKQSASSHNCDYLSKQQSEQNDYDKLVNVFGKLMVSHRGIQASVSQILAQIPQFATSQLLSKSKSPLWKASMDQKSFLSYCKTIKCLSSKNLKRMLIQKEQKKWLYGRTNQIGSKFQIFEADQFVINFFDNRKQFLLQLKNKCKDKLQENALSEISQQIIFLYHRYIKTKQKISQKIKQKIPNQFLELSQKALEKLKQLTKQLKQLKKNKIKKNKKHSNFG